MILRIRGQNKDFYTMILILDKDIQAIRLCFFSIYCDFKNDNKEINLINHIANDKNIERV